MLVDRTMRTGCFQRVISLVHEEALYLVFECHGRTWCGQCKLGLDAHRGANGRDNLPRTREVNALVSRVVKTPFAS